MLVGMEKKMSDRKHGDFSVIFKNGKEVEYLDLSAEVFKELTNSLKDILTTNCIVINYYGPTLSERIEDPQSEIDFLECFYLYIKLVDLQGVFFKNKNDNVCIIGQHAISHEIIINYMNGVELRIIGDYELYNNIKNARNNYIGIDGTGDDFYISLDGLISMRLESM
jgi:hypothetical protein